MLRPFALGVVVAVAALSAGGCGLLSFDVSQDLPPQTVPGNPVAALLPSMLFQVPIMIDLRQATAAQGTGPAKSANLKSLTLTLTAPAGGNFDFIDSITVDIAAPGLSTTQIAAQPAVPRAQSTISIPPTGNVDLVPYINAGAEIRAAGSGHLPAQDVTYGGHVVVTVHV